MKISYKLTAIMVALGLFAIASVSITLLLRSRASITGISEQYAVTMANDSAADIINFLDSYMDKVETAAHVMEQYRYMITANRRSILNVILVLCNSKNYTIRGYSLFSLTRASLVENCQSTPFWD
jgi:hypothetical protein